MDTASNDSCLGRWWVGGLSMLLSPASESDCGCAARGLVRSDCQDGVQGAAGAEQRAHLLSALFQRGPEMSCGGVAAALAGGDGVPGGWHTLQRKVAACSCSC